MALIRPPQAKYSEQNVLSTSFDPTYGLLQVEAMTYNPVLSQMEPAVNFQGNASIVLTYTDGNLTQVEKTIGSTTYTKTLTYTDGNLTGVSAWS